MRAAGRLVITVPVESFNGEIGENSDASLTYQFSPGFVVRMFGSGFGCK